MVNAVVVCLAAASICVIPAAVCAQQEELEPRMVGRPGMTSVGMAGFADRFFSSEEELPTNYTAQVDILRFLTRRIAVRGGVVGSGSFGGETTEDAKAGSGAPALHGLGGVSFYFTPASMVSAYVGAEYWGQITQRSGRDVGSLIGTAGVQGAFSSRASFFIQGGYGARLNRGDDNELLTRFVGQIGLRIRM